MKELDLYYEVRDLFNTSSRAFDIFYQVKMRIKNKDHVLPRNLLMIFPTRESLERTKKRALVEPNINRINKNTLCDAERTYTFVTIADVENNKLVGRNFADIRFLG